ncbi:hypothetical protein EWM64_g1751 [Hericium alpestre]|uniref:Uncharacterized protein n=1 Tax=Hericium alpestre TaxID=135208 RepID=A0A4Z0A7L1_9AGAM|nr:hypothetical protein EWM64_g1751 [Hericium alpestre]
MASEGSSPTDPGGSSTMTKATTWLQILLPDPPEGRWRMPLHTNNLRRYERKYKIPKQNTISVIPPMTTHFPHSTESGCGNWVPVTHPEGGLYFYDSERHIFTDAYVYDPLIADEAEQFIAHLDEILKLYSKSLPPNYELVLEIEPWDDGEFQLMWGYYYIDHDTRSQFWLEEFESADLIWELDGVSTFSHIGHAIESQYW